MGGTLTDRERILGAVIEWLTFNRPVPGAVAPGDLVLLVGAQDRLPIGFYVGQTSEGAHVLREVGGEIETGFAPSTLLLPLKLPPEKMLEGAQHRTYEHVLGAVKQFPEVEFATLQFEPSGTGNMIRGTVYLRCASRKVPWGKQVVAVGIPFQIGTRFRSAAETHANLRETLAAGLAEQLGGPPYIWTSRFVEIPKNESVTSTWRL